MYIFQMPIGKGIFVKYLFFYSKMVTFLSLHLIDESKLAKSFFIHYLPFSFQQYSLVHIWHPALPFQWPSVNILHLFPWLPA